jgi:hypothetical protein
MAVSIADRHPQSPLPHMCALFIFYKGVASRRSPLSPPRKLSTTHRHRSALSAVPLDAAPPLSIAAGEHHGVPHLLPPRVGLHHKLSTAARSSPKHQGVICSLLRGRLTIASCLQPPFGPTTTTVSSASTPRSTTTVLAPPSTIHLPCHRRFPLAEPHRHGPHPLMSLRPPRGHRFIPSPLCPSSPP